MFVSQLLSRRAPSEWRKTGLALFRFLLSRRKKKKKTSRFHLTLKSYGQVIQKKNKVISSCKKMTYQIQSPIYHPSLTSSTDKLAEEDSLVSALFDETRSFLCLHHESSVGMAGCCNFGLKFSGLKLLEKENNSLSNWFGAQMSRTAAKCIAEHKSLPMLDKATDGPCLSKMIYLDLTS